MSSPHIQWLQHMLQTQRIGNLSPGDEDPLFGFASAWVIRKTISAGMPSLVAPWPETVMQYTDVDLYAAIVESYA